MQIKCENCGEEDVARYKNLIEKGWQIFFLFAGVKVIRCKKCKPNLKDKIKTKFNKDYKSEMYYDIQKMINKMKILKGLKTKEEKGEESYKRRMKKRRNYHYQRNIHKKKGSKKCGQFHPSGWASHNVIPA